MPRTAVDTCETGARADLLVERRISGCTFAFENGGVQKRGIYCPKKFSELERQSIEEREY